MNSASSLLKKGTVPLTGLIFSKNLTPLRGTVPFFNRLLDTGGRDGLASE
jgi:hypothetical protein